MTVQADESLEYRGESYSLIGTPLKPYLENRKDINFELFDTAHWRGYHGYWRLESNQLYLINLESSNLTMVDLFKTSDPILASWYSGELKFGIGEFKYDDLWGHFDNYVWLKIENGKVTERKIVAHISQDPEFVFGKYKGKSIEEVVNGRIQRNTSTTIRDFLICLLEFIVDPNYENKIKCPSFNITEQDRDLVHEIRNSHIEYFLSQNFIATSSKVFWENTNEDERAEKLSAFLEKILTSDFTVHCTLSRENLESAEFAENSTLINGDLQYVNWALQNVEFFSIPPNFLEKSFSLKTLKGFKTKRLNKLIFEYEPIIELTEYVFAENILNVNREKFEKEKQVKYDSLHDVYCPDFSETTMMKIFGHYLDEEYVRPPEPEPESQRSYDEYNTNNWLRDAAGTDDPEAMNEAFWNLD